MNCRFLRAARQVPRRYELAQFERLQVCDSGAAVSCLSLNRASADFDATVLRFLRQF